MHFLNKLLFCIIFSILFYSELFSSDNKNIAILNFDSQGISSDISITLTEKLRSEIFNIGKYSLLERDKINQILNEYKLQQSGLTRDSDIVKIGKLLNVNYMLVGNVGLVGQTYSISIRMFNIESGQIIRYLTDEYKGKLDGLLNIVIPDLARKICGLEIKDDSRYSYYLRDIPGTISVDDAKNFLMKYNCFDSNFNPSGSGLKNDFELAKYEQVVIDHLTGLMFLQSGSKTEMNYYEAVKYINNLNSQGFAGYYDWRLPTMFEAMSLMERNKFRNAKLTFKLLDIELNIDPIFDFTQLSIWTSNRLEGTSKKWFVSYKGGFFGACEPNILNFVRPVRSIY